MQEGIVDVDGPLIVCILMCGGCVAIGVSSHDEGEVQSGGRSALRHCVNVLILSAKSAPQLLSPRSLPTTSESHEQSTMHSVKCIELKVLSSTHKQV